MFKRKKKVKRAPKKGIHELIMDSFTLRTIPDLDVCVLASLELFKRQSSFPKMKIPYKRPLVVGSGNAAATGKIIFRNTDAVFADESNFKEKLKAIKAIDGVVLISASGAKHAPIIAKEAKRFKKHVTLVTNTQNSLAKQFLDQKHPHDEYVFPKNREPYTYNTSTYMGMIFGHTKENPERILNFIKKTIDKKRLPRFAKYRKYYLVVPEEFEGIIRLLNVKFIELFGRNISRDIETFEYVKHATTVVPANDELFITFGKKPRKSALTLYGKNHFHVPLPKRAGYAAMMAISYYLVGKIQKKQPAWFKRNIAAYCKKVSKEFGHTIKPIVE